MRLVGLSSSVLFLFIAGTFPPVLNADNHDNDGGFYVRSESSARGLGKDNLGDALFDFNSFYSTRPERKLFSGYKFNQYFSMEAAWIDPVEVQRRGESGEGSDSYSPGALVSAKDKDGLSLGAVGTVPLSDQFGLFAKASVYKWDDEDFLARSLSSGSASEDYVTDSALGFGARYNFSENFSVSAEWERFNRRSDEDIDFLSIGISTRF